MPFVSREWWYLWDDGFLCYLNVLDFRQIDFTSQDRSLLKFDSYRFNWERGGVKLGLDDDRKCKKRR